MDLVTRYKASQKFLSKSPKTKKDYLRYLKRIEDDFGTMELSALKAKGARGKFMDWRDEIAVESGERTGHGHWTMLKTVLNDAKDRTDIDYNPCDGGGIYKSDRSDIIWPQPFIDKVWQQCSTGLRTAMMLALWTGLREGNIVALLWKAYDGTHIEVRINKTKRKAGKSRTVGVLVRIKVSEQLKAHLDSLERVSDFIVTNREGEPYTESGFRSSWGKAYDRAEIPPIVRDDEEEENYHFHDLRGTAITNLSRGGATTQEIATLTGLSLKTVNDILERYLHRDPELSDAAIVKLEAYAKAKAAAAAALQAVQEVAISDAPAPGEAAS
ncbi:tyrosine-type recombinase/integrase [Bradyrhizobium neotropicale]|uniref:tyrosine-type recombinase/integrase n=1 Tax=Bradyrhizobium neotropicale TaxID=1497615 RepID=UPI001AD66E93|nr:tyrosine-type recombinase/integrase [Bradyrhizobium neotropicale]MBO4228168.1 tyrosine-type recombinase/integrase [Bradyrhizobium neotropicale]